ncbi:unnamed protein product [Durusdinium trenchii]|uniref:Uncharacterized protein n=1 Tax=Durusdinium trenchii TaxID=1381693 RepID=A0ABP0SLH8_9DINO
MVSYDQLNVVSLASAEALNRRRALIEIAHQGRPEGPSYEGAEEILGVRESADGSVVDPAITSRGKKRLAAEEKRFTKRITTEGDDDVKKNKGKKGGNLLRAPVLICLGSGLGTYFPYRFLLILFFHGDVKSRAHVDRPPPDSHQSPQAALRQLLKIGAAYESPGQLASYVREKVSLPSGQEAAVELLSILPDRDRKILENFEEEMLLGPEERAAVLETGVEGLSHMDPLLANDAKRYHQFVSELYKSGLIGFTSILKAHCFLANQTLLRTPPRIRPTCARDWRLHRALEVLGDVELERDFTEIPKGWLGGGALRKSRECKTVIKVFTKEEARKRNGFVGNKAPLTEVANTSQQRRRERSWYELPLYTEADLDQALCEFVDQLLLDGEDVSFGQKLQAAVEFERPEFSRDGRLSLAGHERVETFGSTADTTAHVGILEVSHQRSLLASWLQGEALYNEATFSTYARPGEMLRVYAEDVVAPNRDFNFPVIVLGPLERGVASKVGIYDEALILDDVRAPWLGKLLIEQSKQQVKALGEDTPLWNFKAADYLKKWKDAVEKLGSRDHLLKLRMIPAIQRRGRWACDASARIYDKPGRLQQAINQYSSAWQRLADELQKNFGMYYRNGTSQLPRNLVRQLKVACEPKFS